ncbi:MAG: CHAT domain-containing protein [Pyrinomonadaceae bacterium MAG19_C2-C3]|nr:CHAT domain-containing protein [Pyrinomonadaceae bacterium MAG19_C2-C3]
MVNEKEFVARVEAAGADELASILTRPSADEERALRAYFGDELYQRLHAMSLRRNISRGTRALKGKVIVIHGIMGSDLASFDSGGDVDHIWVKVARLVMGRFSRLQLNDDGLGGEHDVRATGIMKRYYGELMLSLSQTWEVRPYWFDWRKDLNLAANELAAKISNWFSDNEPFHIVAHSMGGLVARTFIKNHRRRWETAQDTKHNLKAGGRLVMLGTPNHGAFCVPQILTGLEPIIRKIALFDLRHDLEELLEISNTFVGSYQMLPSQILDANMAKLYQSETYVGFKVSQRCLDKAKKHHEELSDIVDVERMIYVAGYDQPTLGGIRDFTKLGRAEAYEVTLDGDGRVAHRVGLLHKNNKQVPTFYIKEEHGSLASNETVIRAVDNLIEVGTTALLSTTLPARRTFADITTQANQDQLRREYARRQTDEIEYTKTFAARLQTQTQSKRSSNVSANFISVEERRVEEFLTRGFLGGEAVEAKRDEDAAKTFIPRLEIALLHGGIEDLDHNADYRRSLSNGNRTKPIDAISVGHYIGVKPTAAEYALDLAISRKLPGKLSAGENHLSEADLVLTQYTERGIIRGELGQPFFLNDPRATATTAGDGRTIAVVGMGEPGRFGSSELVVLARELCWSLGRLGKRHLATVLIGSGVGTLAPRDAVSAWLRGASRALAGSAHDAGRHLTRITFIEHNPRRVEEINDAIIHVKQTMAANRTLDVIYQGISPTLKQALPRLIREREEGDWQRERLRRKRLQEAQANGFAKTFNNDNQHQPLPTQVTVSLDNNVYRFGAITEEASIPERAIPIDASLVMRANDELAAEQNPAKQFENGQFLEQLLLPNDLRAKIYTDAPLVMLLDATTARVHWEMVAQTGISGGEVRGDAVKSFDDVADYFVGTGRGFTRRLRTTFAPPPEPPPPPRRVLKVLVVADPAEDARLPGAEEEGVEVADLFESFNKVYADTSDNRIAVTRLFAPREATRTNVMKHLMLHSYDVLHYAGHCMYDHADPTASGWIFSDGERLSAKELNRVDRIPKFVFSNACESGITPDRSELRTVELAPSFAEAFFARGVANFVCTAWSVDDFGARLFAKRLYACLLGLQETEDNSNMYERATNLTPVMHIAMREARRAVAATDFGARTWGAYQHYGNPYLQFFDQRTLSGEMKEEHPNPRNTPRIAAVSSGNGQATTSKKGSGKKTANKKTASKKVAGSKAKV